MITMNATQLRSLISNTLPSRERIAQEVKTLGELLQQAEGDKNVAQLLVIRHYGPATLNLATQLGGYLEIASEMLPMLIEQAETALPAIERGKQFMADNPGYEVAFRAYLVENEAPEEAYLQSVGQIGAALLEDPENEAEIQSQLAPIVAEYGTQEEPDLFSQAFPDRDLFAAMLG